MKTQTTIRIEETNYFQAKDILNQIGLTYSQAIGNMWIFITCVITDNSHQPGQTSYLILWEVTYLTLTNNKWWTNFEW